MATDYDSGEVYEVGRRYTEKDILRLSHDKRWVESLLQPLEEAMLRLKDRASVRVLLLCRVMLIHPTLCLCCPGAQTDIIAMNKKRMAQYTREAVMQRVRTNASMVRCCCGPLIMMAPDP